MQLRSFLLLIPPHQPAVGCTRSWEGTPLGQQNVQKDIPYPMASHTACSAGGGRKEEGGGTFGGMVFVFPSQCYMWWSSAAPGMAKHLCLPMGREGVGKVLGLLCLHAWFLLIKLSSSQTTFVTLTLLILSHKPMDSLPLLQTLLSFKAPNLPYLPRLKMTDLALM